MLDRCTCVVEVNAFVYSNVAVISLILILLSLLLYPLSYLLCIFIPLSLTHRSRNDLKQRARLASYVHQNFFFPHFPSKMGMKRLLAHPLYLLPQTLGEICLSLSYCHLRWSGRPILPVLFPLNLILPPFLFHFFF